MKGWPRYDPEFTAMIYDNKPPYVAILWFLVLCVIAARIGGN